jgi:hypothetical protein
MAALEAIQQFEPVSIARSDTLGKALDFTPAVPVVGRVVQFFRLFPKEHLLSLPDTQRSQVTSHAEVCWKTVQAMLKFDPNTANPANERQGLINQLDAQFSDSVSSLGGSLAVVTAMHRTGAGVEAEAQSALNAAKSTAEKMGRLEQETSESVSRLLAEVRGVAAQAGVAHEANHFGEQAGKHATAAAEWQRYTNYTAAALIAFAILAYFVGYIVDPKTAYQTAQLALSKVLIFSTIAFLLFQCARTMMAHRHNEVVNRHRQNALLTFNTLTGAAGDPQTKEIVLTHASACIYAPQESGFSKSGSATSSPSLVEVLPRIMGGSQGS